MTPGKELDWYLYLNSVLAEANEEITVTSSALQASFVDDLEESGGDKSTNEEELVPDEDESDDEGEKSRDLGKPNNKKSLKKRMEKYNGQNQKWIRFDTRKRA